MFVTKLAEQMLLRRERRQERERRKDKRMVRRKRKMFINTSKTWSKTITITYGCRVTVYSVPGTEIPRKIKSLSLFVHLTFNTMSLFSP